MNALDRWRSEQGWTYQRLADELECNHASASRYCQGRRIPEPAAMARIHAMTGGAVTANDFYGLPEPRPWIIVLVQPDHRRVDYEARGWSPWPDSQDGGGPALLYRRKARDGESWQDLLAEMEVLTQPRRRLAPGALVASGVDPN